jgi:hypothetical protein
LFPELINGVMQSNFERDSTAITDDESQFFVLQKEAFNKMSHSFQPEFKELQELANYRRERHRKLKAALFEKVKKLYA